MEIKNEAARAFFDRFMQQRMVNVEFYKRVPEDKLDFRMVDTAERKSDSPRESIAHQIYVTKKYIYGVKTGELAFDGVVDEPLQQPDKRTKAELLVALQATNEELLNMLSNPEVAARLVKVSWSGRPIPALLSLEGLYAHEIFHEGWNLAIMDHLNIERFPEMKAIWG